VSASGASPHELDAAERVRLAQRLLGIDFTDEELLRTALTHPSSLANEAQQEHYERLEFLGDAVIGFLFTDHLFRTYPDLPEGRMTKVRSAFVSGRALAQAAERLGLAEAVIVGPGAESIRQSHARSLMADSLEAVVGALYIDQGLDAARQVLFRLVTPDVVERTIEEATEDDPKNLLQEHTQALDGTLPEYRIVAVEGPPHDRVFTAEVRVAGRTVGKGTGASKKDAQRRAAAAALSAVDTVADTD
jgi:ribonuclease-3